MKRIISLQNNSATSGKYASSVLKLMIISEYYPAQSRKKQEREKKNPTLSRKILDGVGIVMLITAEYVSGVMDGFIP